MAGSAAAAALISGFKAFWREVRVSHPVSNSVPEPTLLGLAGVTIELTDLEAAGRLTVDEARMAAMLGLYELKGFPTWYEALSIAHPSAVESVLKEAVDREWDAGGATEYESGWSGYSASSIRAVIAEAVLRGVDAESCVPDSIVRVVGYPLILSSVDRVRVATAMGRVVRGGPSLSPEQKSARIRIWAHVDPVAAARWLSELVVRDHAQGALVVTEVAALLDEDVREKRFEGRTLLLTPRSLELWIPLLFRTIRPQDDIHRKGAYTPSSRDEAQRFRERCVWTLALNPTTDARHAFLRVRADPVMGLVSRWLNELDEKQRAQAAELAATAWSPANVVALERGDDRRPETMEDLSRLVQRRLARVARLLENADFSYREFFLPRTPEKAVQLWVASTLELMSRNLYSILREPVVQDDNRIDVAAVVPGVNRLPIEIKPAAAGPSYS